MFLLCFFQDFLDQAQNKAFFLLEEEKKERATIDSDSSIYEVYGKKKEGLHIHGMKERYTCKRHLMESTLSERA